MGCDGDPCGGGECQPGGCDGFPDQCGMSCTDTQIDPLNCGECGNECDEGDPCNDGDCGN
jgi:hypothetical protein